MVSKLRQRIARRNAARAEGFAFAEEASKLLFREKWERAQYLIENGATESEAWSIVDSSYDGQQLSKLRKKAKR